MNSKGWQICLQTSFDALKYYCIADKHATKKKREIKQKSKAPPFLPILGSLGKFVLGFLVLSVQPHHKPTSQLGLRLLQLGGKIKDLPSSVLRILYTQ